MRIFNLIVLSSVIWFAFITAAYVAMVLAYIDMSSTCWGIFSGIMFNVIYLTLKQLTQPVTPPIQENNSTEQVGENS